MTDYFAPAYKAGLSVKLHADGKNFRQWDLQFRNAAIAYGASALINGSDPPKYNPKHKAYELRPYMEDPVGSDGTSSADDIIRTAKLNKAFKFYNDERIAKREADRKAYEQWVKANAALMNLVLASVDNSLIPMLSTFGTLAEMYDHLWKYFAAHKGNVRSSWIAFVDLRASDCKSVRQYINKFQEVMTEAIDQGLRVRIQKKDPVEEGNTITASKLLNRDAAIAPEILLTHFLHRLRDVLPDWVDARYNDIRTGTKWEFDDLIASLEELLTNEKDDPVKVFHARTTAAAAPKPADNKPKNNNNSGSNGNSNGKGRADNKDKKPWQIYSNCTICNKEHGGGTKYCFDNPNRPADAPKYDPRKKRGESSKPAAAAVIATGQTPTVSYSHSEDWRASAYFAASFFTDIGISQRIVANAAADSTYLNRLCYDTGANRYIFNNKRYFIKISETLGAI